MVEGEWPLYSPADARSCISGVRPLQNGPVIPPRPPPEIDRLGDNFGQYVITLKCACEHARRAQPATLAAFAGWEARLVDVVRRMRCSKCGERRCSTSVRHEHKRDE